VNKLNRTRMESRSAELAAPQRRENERSESDRSGGATNSARPASAGTSPVPDPEVAATAKRRRFSAEYKLSILAQVESCREQGEIGALLRREGLYSSHLSKWRQQRQKGALAELAPKKRGPKPTANPLTEEYRRLQAENARLKRQLQQAETIIDVQKKVSTLLGIQLPEPLTDEENS
jgi:transposase